MTITQLPVGVFSTNCYLVDRGDRLYVVDPGAEPEKIRLAAADLGFDRGEILLTHAHFDHIGAVETLAQMWQLDQVRLGAEDHGIYRSPRNAYLPYYPPLENPPRAREYEDTPDFRVLPLPGHTPGGRGLLFTDGNVSHLLVGDTVFAGSIGRTDLPGGDYEAILDSIRTRIETLPDDVVLYPGHGETTTVGAERRNNPYFSRKG